MPYFKAFCIFCSVRLGAIIVGIFTAIVVAIYAPIIASGGPDWLSKIAKYGEDFIRTNDLSRDGESYQFYFTYMETNKDTLHIAFISLHSALMVACVLDIIGAFLLNPWLLIPYILLDLSRLVIGFGSFCILMIVVKKSINLGFLITYWVLGTFVLLFFAYLWACVLSLFQVIFIVRSEKYRSVYGNDPLQPKPKSSAMKSTKKSKVERVKFFPSPNFNNDTDKLKSSSKANKRDEHPFTISRSQRIQNEYVEMRRSYLDEPSVGHG